MLLRDPAADVQAEAEAAIVPHRHCALEAAEDPAELRRIDPDSMIPDREPRHPALRADEELDGLASPELDGIGEEVGHDPVEAGAIPAPHDRGVGVQRDRAPGPRQIRLEARDDLADEGPELDDGELERHAPCVEARDVEEIVDEPGQAGSLA